MDATESGSTRSGLGLAGAFLPWPQGHKVARAVDQTKDEDPFGGDLVDQPVTA